MKIYDDDWLNEQPDEPNEYGLLNTHLAEDCPTPHKCLEPHGIRLRKALYEWYQAERIPPLRLVEPDETEKESTT